MRNGASSGVFGVRDVDQRWGGQPDCLVHRVVRWVSPEDLLDPFGGLNVVARWARRHVARRQSAQQMVRWRHKCGEFASETAFVGLDAGPRQSRVSAGQE